MAQPPRRRRWLPILAGIAILLCFIVIGGIIAMVTIVRHTVNVQAVEGTDAESEFAKVRAQFPDRAPLLEVRPGGHPRFVVHRAAPGSQPGRIDTLHLLAWDPDDQKLARVSLPFWFLRLKSTPIELSSYTSGLDEDGVKFSAEDVEQHGPGIILDHTNSSGERVLFWAQ